METIRDRSILAIVAAVLASCGLHYATPSHRAHDARFGYLAGSGSPPPRAQLCSHWEQSVGARDAHATRHISYPETDAPTSCFVPVRYTDERIEVGAVPDGCGVPSDAQREGFVRLAERFEQSPEGVADPDLADLFPCRSTPEARRATLAHNARALRAAAAETRGNASSAYPYGAVAAFGFGWPDQARSSIVHWLPTEACHTLDRYDMESLGPMVLRARRAAEALRAHVAPVIIASGGTEHSPMVEAFAMLFVLHCALHVPRERVLLEPCAEHTHTNLRNVGRWLTALGLRTAYVVTDDGLQRGYLQEYSGFELVFGSMDQRSLRDFGYLLGAWRQASEGPNIGYWYTPYRFWAEPRDGLGSVTCTSVAETP